MHTGFTPFLASASPLTEVLVRDQPLPNLTSNPHLLAGDPPLAPTFAPCRDGGRYWHPIPNPAARHATRGQQWAPVGRRGQVDRSTANGTETRYTHLGIVDLVVGLKRLPVMAGNGAVSKV